MCHTFTSMHDRCYDNTCLTEGKYNHYAWNNATQLAMHGTCQTSHIMHGKCQRLTLSIAICKTIVITIVRFCYAWQTHANLEMSNDRHCCMTHAKQKKNYAWHAKHPWQIQNLIIMSMPKQKRYEWSENAWYVSNIYHYAWQVSCNNNYAWQTANSKLLYMTNASHINVYFCSY